jgi:hypothetical protein
MRDAIARSGLKKSPNPAFAVEPNSVTSSSMGWTVCVRKCGALC